MASASFRIHGIPVAQGSKIAGVSKSGHAFMRESSAKKLRPWRQDVAAQALLAMEGRELMVGPVSVIVTFLFPRPKAHYRTGRHAANLRDDAPDWHASKPDLSKLVRALEDALTGVVFRDDAQVASMVVGKRYCRADEQPGAMVNVVLAESLCEAQPCA